MPRALQGRQRAIMLRVLASWHTWAQTHARRIAALVDCMEHHGHQLMIKTFRTWHANVMQIADERAMLRMCCTHIDHVRLRAIMHAWQDWAHRCTWEQQAVMLTKQRVAVNVKVGCMAFAGIAFSVTKPD